MTELNKVLARDRVQLPITRRYKVPPTPEITEGTGELTTIHQPCQQLYAYQPPNTLSMGFCPNQNVLTYTFPCLAPNGLLTPVQYNPAIKPQHNISSYGLGYEQIVPVPSMIIDSNSINNISINPYRLGFLPQDITEDKQIMLRDIIKSHFQIRSTKKVRFEHKLWNALCITKSNPMMFRCIGVMWISNYILKVHRTIFANLLGITKPTAALFNIQGSFPSHGFVEIDIKQASKQLTPQQLADVDGIQIRLFEHQEHLFTCSSGIEELVNCRWKENFAF